MMNPMDVVISDGFWLVAQKEDGSGALGHDVDLLEDGRNGAPVDVLRRCAAV